MRAAVLDEPHERDVAADVLAQQLVGLEQVVLVVLLEHVETRRLGQRSEVHRRRVDRGRDVHEPQVERAARQLDVADVAHEREVRVVDGECELGLVVERGRILALHLRLGGTGRGAVEPEAHRTCQRPQERERLRQSRDAHSCEKLLLESVRRSGLPVERRVPGNLADTITGGAKPSLFPVHFPICAAPRRRSTTSPTRAWLSRCSWPCASDARCFSRARPASARPRSPARLPPRSTPI